MRITVSRQPADNPADPVVEPLLTTQEAMVERGRNELDDASSNRFTTRLQLPFKMLIQPGDLIEVQSTQETWRGKVLSTGVSIDRNAINQTLTIERPA